MDRLTRRGQGGIVGCAYEQSGHCRRPGGGYNACDDCVWENEAIDRLADYEDTGHTPEEVAALVAAKEAQV